MTNIRLTDKLAKPLRDRPMPGEESAPYITATWEFPPCLRCGGECIFDDGICQLCWLAYQEKQAVA